MQEAQLCWAQVPKTEASNYRDAFSAVKLFCLLPRLKSVEATHDMCAVDAEDFKTERTTKGSVKFQHGLVELEYIIYAA